MGMAYFRRGGDGGPCGRFEDSVQGTNRRAQGEAGVRRDGRVAEGARLESVYTARYPGFESLSLRQHTSTEIQKNPNFGVNRSKLQGFFVVLIFTVHGCGSRGACRGIG